MQEMLCFMAKLKCEKICREKENGDTSCKILKYCRDSRFYGCYECDKFKACDKLKSLEELHGYSCVNNMKIIKKMGLEAWISRGKRLWGWQ